MSVDGTRETKSYSITPVSLLRNDARKNPREVYPFIPDNYNGLEGDSGETQVAPCVWSPVYRDSFPLDPLSSRGTSSGSGSGGGGSSGSSRVISAPRFVSLSFRPLVV